MISMLLIPTDNVDNKVQVLTASITQVQQVVKY